MKKLIPLIILAALALANPAGAQARHWYKNGVETAEGHWVPTLTWGTTTITNKTAETSETCRTVMGGDIYNTASNGGYQPGFFDSFDCVSPKCEALHLVPMMKAVPGFPVSEWGGGLYENLDKFTLAVHLEWECPEGHLLGYAGNLIFAVENGMAVGTAPMRLTLINEGEVPNRFAGTWKMMGYEGQEALAER